MGVHALAYGICKGFERILANKLSYRGLQGLIRFHQV